MSLSSQILAWIVLCVWLSSVGVAFSEEAFVGKANSLTTFEVVVTTAEERQVEFRVIAFSDSAADELIKGMTPWAGSVDIAQGYSRLRIVADNYWAGDIVLSTASDRPIHFNLVSATLLVAEIETPKTFPKPKMAMLETTTSQQDSSREAFETPSACEIDKQRLNCVVPVGKRDLCLRIEHLSRQCFWDLAPTSEKVLDLGTIKFVAGSSLSGVLDATDRSLVLANTMVELKPRIAAASPNPVSSQRREILGRKTRSDQHGRFSFSGLRSGEYRVLVHKKGYFGVEQRIEIASDVLELDLEEPLLLVSPAILDLEIDPPLDPWKRPWTLKLTRPSESPDVHETVEDGHADRGGRWSIKGIIAGSYSMRIGDSKGATWENHRWMLDPGENRRFVSIDLVPIRGQISVGDEGVEAEIIFGTTQGLVQVTVQSDEEGDFEGALPHEGLWGVDLRIDRDWGSQGLEPIEVKRRSGKSYARVDIELPDTALKGSVVYEGEPAEALVLAFREQQPQTGIPARRREIVLKTDEKGQFEVRGIVPGSFTIQAYNRVASSVWETVQLQEGLEPVGITLELQQVRELQGRLVGALGGVSGARIEMMPSHGLQRTLVSEIDGSFRIRLDSEATFVDFFVLPPGGAFFFQRVSIFSDDNAQPIVLQMNPESGTIVLEDLAADGWLKFNGLGASLENFRRWLLPDGRVRGHWSGGYELSNAAVGIWSFCFEGSESCQEQTLFAGGEVMFQSQETHIEEEPRQ